MKIASRIPDWLEYAHSLRLTEQEINGIQRNPHLTFRMQNQEMLRTWYRKNSYSILGTYRALLEVFCELERPDVAGEICKVLQGTLSPPVENVTVISQDLVLFTDKSIGGGAFGSVFKGEFNGQPCAVKVLHNLASEIQTCLPTAVLANKDSVERFQQECQYLESFKHPNIVQHLATEKYPQTCHLVLVLELMECSLREYFSSTAIADIKTDFTCIITTSLCHDIISALVYIHERCIVHRDLRGDNILLNSTSCPNTIVAKVGDFGMSRIVEIEERQSISLPTFGHRGYLPPEALIFDSVCFDSSFDIFQFGVLMLQIVHCLPTIKCEQERANELDKLDSIHPLKQLIQNCLLKDRSKRPTAVELERRLRPIK